MKCVIVIPIYKEQLNIDEESCVKRYEKVLQGEDIVFVAPQSLKLDYYKNTFPNITYAFFADKYFTGTKAYNHLMLSTHFYDYFTAYDYMLIAQTDAVIWANENRLNEFMELGYDYIGAPWIPERNIWEWRWNRRNNAGARFECCKKKGRGISMGNGGFCLRKVDKCKALIKEFSWRKIYWFIKRNEDIFFGVFGEYNKCGFRLADTKNGLRFAREYDLRQSVENGEIPFGVHGWQKEFASYEEMKKFLADYRIEV